MGRMIPEDPAADGPPIDIGGVRLGVGRRTSGARRRLGVMVVRRPDGCSIRTCWAEDGPIFLRAAYLGPRCTARCSSYNGYLNLLLRLMAEFTTLLRWVRWRRRTAWPAWRRRPCATH